MLNVATNNAMPANTTRKLRSAFRNRLLISLMFSLVSCAPVIASMPWGRTGRRLATSCDWDTTGAAFTRMLDTWPGLGPPPHAANASGERAVDRPPLGSRAAAADLGGAAHLRRRPPCHGGEQPIEVDAQGVTQHERPREERHAEDHSDEGAGEAALARPQALQGHVEHVRPLPRCGRRRGATCRRCRWRQRDRG